MGGIFGPGSVVDADGGGESEEGGSGSALGGGEMSGLMHKLLGECSKWLEIFTPQVCKCAAVGAVPLRSYCRERKHERTCLRVRALV